MYTVHVVLALVIYSMCVYVRVLYAFVVHECMHTHIYLCNMFKGFTK